MMKRETFAIANIYVPAKRRSTLDPDKAREIAESMLQIGQQTPILVRRDGERFVLVDGLHRLEACKQLGEDTIGGYLVQERRHSPQRGRRQRARQRIDPARAATCAPSPDQFGFWYLSTNSSTGPVGRLTEKSRVSSGWRRKLPSPTSLKPTASTSPRSTLSSMRWNVFPTATPSPGRAEWSAMTSAPPGLSAA